MSRDIINQYFAAFNNGDTDGMLICLSEDVAHYVNEGRIRTGKAAFADFCDHMTRCYREELTDMVVFFDAGTQRGAAEYVVNGTYIASDEGLPDAANQTYRLPAGSFFSMTDGKISRVVTYYNLADWVRQVSS